MPKLLVLAIYPAPYRVELINEITKQCESDVFFENSTGDSRNEEWFSKGNYYILDTKEGKNRFEQARKNIRQYSLVLIYDYSTKESIKLILRCRLTGVPYTLNADGVMLTEHGNPVKELAKRILISGAKACFASGNYAKRYFEEYGADSNNIFLHTFSTLHSCDILTTPIDEDRKRILRRQLSLPQEGYIAIAVGRFIPLKRYTELIQAWKDVRSDITLLLIGGGELQLEYYNTVDNMHLSNVIIESFHPKDELEKYYQASDIFVHPTSYDVWGLVVNEAMANGLPAVVSNRCIAGLELIRNGENGFLFELDDYETMKNYIKLLFENDELRYKMREEALTTVKQYTIENMAESQTTIIKRLIGYD